MAKATTTIRQTLNYKPEQRAWFAANQALFNRVAAFYFEVIQAHEHVLELGNQDALTALEQLTHATRKHPHPVMPLAAIADNIPAMFRRAAIHAALGSARSFQAHLKTWHIRKEKALAKGKKFTERPPVPPRSWNRSVTLYAGLWKERTPNSILLKVWTGRCWSWVKCRITGRELPCNTEAGSPQLVRHGTQWWLHTPVERETADGHAFPLYPSHTTAPTGVEATLQVLWKPTTEGWKKRLDDSLHGVSHTVLSDQGQEERTACPTIRQTAKNSRL